ncbi:hypothetical protein Ddc_14783 [Ditylenchus destructor]|nr:hypothetical protein Ddc_14783 [Ditylenchus destructor]
MSSFPNEIFYNITNFLPNDDIADLMLMSRNFNALVTPRLRKIDQQMATMNQSIESFMPLPAPEPSNNVWISQLNLKRFEPIGSQAKKRLTEAFYRINLNNLLELIRLILKDRNRLPCHEEMIDKYKEIMSLERYDTATFVRILCALIATPKFRQDYKIPIKFAHHIWWAISSNERFDDVARIYSFYNGEL